MKCEWCGAPASGDYYSNTNPDGTRQGRFCSPKCYHEARAKGFHGTVQSGCMILVAAVGVLGVAAGAVLAAG